MLRRIRVKNAKRNKAAAKAAAKAKKEQQKKFRKEIRSIKKGGEKLKAFMQSLRTKLNAKGTGKRTAGT